MRWVLERRNAEERAIYGSTGQQAILLLQLELSDDSQKQVEESQNEHLP